MAKTILCVDGFINLHDFKDFVDVGRVVYYTLKHKKDGTLTLKFYDKKEKLIKPYGK
jgi:hypothetical protein